MSNIKTTNILIPKQQDNYFEIENMLDRQNKIANDVFKLLLTYQGHILDQHFFGEDSKEINFIQKRQELYLVAKQADPLVTEDVFNLTCDGFVNQIASKSNMSNDLFKAFEVAYEELSEMKSYVAGKSEAKKLACKLKQWGVLPSFDNHIGEIKSGLSNAFGRFKSWYECDKMTQENFQKHVDSKSAYLEEMGDVISDRFQEFANELGNVYNSKGLDNFDYFGGKFLLFYEQILKPSFEKGEVCYSGSIEFSNGKKQQYSIYGGIIDLLFKYKELWETKSWSKKVKRKIETVEQCTFSRFYNIFEDFKYLRKNKQRAGFREFSSTSSASICLSNSNIIKYDITQVDGDRNNFYLTINGKQIQCRYRTKKIKYNKTTVEKTVENKCYLDNLEIEKQIKNDKPTGNYIFKFDVNKKRSNIATVNEPKIFKNRKGIYISLCMNIDLDDGKYDENKNIAFYLKTKYFNTYTKEADTLPLLKNKTVRIMGVDTGIKPIYTYSILDYKNGKITDPNIHGKLEGKYEFTNYFNMKSLKNVIRDLPKYFQTDDHKELFKSHLFNDLTFTRDELFDELKNFNTLREYKSRKNKGCLIRREIKSYRHKIGRMKDTNFKSDVKDITNVFGIVKYIDSYKQVCSSWNYIGETVETKTQPNFAFADSHLAKYRENLKDNMIKTLVFNIIDEAKKHDVDILAIEDFSSEYSTSTKRDNVLKALFAPSQIQSEIERCAKKEGIALMTVTRHYTSQVVFGKDIFGYRPKENDKTKLKWIENGEIKFVDADINAAKNIAAKLALKDVSPYTLDIEGDGKYFKSSKWDKSKVFKKVNDKFVNVSDQKPKNTKTKMKIFLNGDNYITKEKKNELVEEIKNYKIKT
jgi:hypothetical protein